MSGLRTLAGRYELTEVIGRGGMGTVYRGTDLTLGRTVAVKLLPGLIADHDPTSIERFQREARAAAGLSHPALVAVYDAGEDHETRFIVMEYVPGSSLEAIVREQGPLDPARAADIAAQVADALAVAHAAGIVHRDIKPANVMLTPGGAVKVLDFGIALALGATALTQSASLIGTAAYMAPEQTHGQPATEQSDIYSLGCVLYALLTGHPPFTGEHAAAILHQQISVPPPPIRAQNPAVPAALETLVMQMLAKSPHQRPAGAALLREQLRGLATSSVPPVGGGTAPTAVLTQGSHTAETRKLARSARTADARSPGRRRAVIAALVAVIAVVIAIILLVALGSSSGGAPSPDHAGTTTKAQSVSQTATTTSAATTTTSTTATTTPPATSAPTTSSSTTSSTLSPTPTVSEAAGALTALTTQDVQSGTIDQPAAQQISNDLSNVLNAYAMGNTASVQQMLSRLSQQATMLEQHGDITAAATPGLNTAITNLDTALGTAPATTTTPAPAASGHPTPPTGPPGKTKHHHGHSAAAGFP